MNLAFRLLVLVGTGVSAVLLLGFVVVPALGGPSLVGGSVRAALRGLWEEQFRRESLDAQDRQVTRCLDGKAETIRRLCDGELTLAEAADQFRQLHAESEGLTASLFRDTSLDSEETLGQNVLNWARAYLRLHPGGTRITIEQLEQQLERHLAAHRRGSL